MEPGAATLATWQPLVSEILPSLDEHAIGLVVASASEALSSRARGQGFCVLIAWIKPSSQVVVDHHGWCEIGELSDPEGNFWWTIRWNPTKRQGRLIRYFKKARRGAL